MGFPEPDNILTHDLEVNASHIFNDVDFPRPPYLPELQYPDSERDILSRQLETSLVGVPSSSGSQTLHQASPAASLASSRETTDLRLGCVLCSVVLSQDSMLRHMKYNHFADKRYRCLAVGCAKSSYRKNKLMAHCRSHNTYNRAQPNRLCDEEQIPLPATCPICGMLPGSWDALYACLLSHCPGNWALEGEQHDEDQDANGLSLSNSMKSSELAVEDSQNPGFGLFLSNFARNPSYRLDISSLPEGGEIQKEDMPQITPSGSKIPTAEVNQAHQDTCFLQRSLRGESMVPSQERGLEFQQPGELDHLLNPVAYYEKLDELELRTAEIMGLDSGSLERPLTDYEVHRISRKASSLVLEPPRQGFSNGLYSARNALCYLSSRGFCGSTFSILVEDQIRPEVATVIHLTLDDIKGSSSTAAEHALVLFNLVLGVEGKGKNMVQVSPYLIYNFFENLLPLALVSFSGSHVCRFDMKLWDKIIDEIPVGLGFSFQSRELACLKNFIGGPAWVLGKSGSQKVQAGLKVSLTVQDLQELWGPIWLVGGTSDEGPVIRTERGFIVPLPRLEQASVFEKSGEIDCHWTKEVPGYVNSEDRILLNGNSRILIGTNFGDSGALVVNPTCESQISQIQQHIIHQFQFPGTCNDYYTMEGHDIQLTGGQYVNAGIIIRRKRVPGKTHKDRLLATCCDSKVNIWPLMKLQVGLEISACSGNAQRFALWDALRLSQTEGKRGKEKTQACNHQIADPKCIELCWTKLHLSETRAPALHEISMMETVVPKHNGLNSLVDKIPQETHLTPHQIRSAIVISLKSLENTGIDAEGNLQAYWPFLDAPTNHRIAPTRFNKWLEILTDTRDMSTFAVVSQRCLNFQEECTRRSYDRCRQSYRYPIQKTCLSLRLISNPVSQLEKRSRLFEFGIPMMNAFPFHLTDLSAGSALRVGKRQLHVKKAWQVGQKFMVACISSKFEISSMWTGIPDFHEQLDPEIEGLTAVDVIICSKEYGGS